MIDSLSKRVQLPENYEDAIQRVTEALKQEGFGVLTTIDVKATLKQKLDADFRRYVILGACNPQLAHQALRNDLDVGLLLPCNVIVYESENGEGSSVSIVDPITMLEVAGLPGLESVAKEADARLDRVVASLRA